MALSFESNPGVDKTFSYSEAVRKYKMRSLSSHEGRVASQAKVGLTKTLTEICIQAVSSNFAQYFMSDSQDDDSIESEIGFSEEKTGVDDEGGGLLPPQSRGAVAKLPGKSTLDENFMQKAKEKRQSNPLFTLENQFSKRPCNKYELNEIIRRINEELSLDLGITVAAAHVSNDDYWKRRCLRHKGWENENPMFHGMTYKQTFFEKYVQETLENFNPNNQELKKVVEVLEAAEDFVFNLQIKSMLSHLDPEYFFSRLPNLNKLELTYGVQSLGIKYQRSLFGMKIFDGE